MLVLFGGCFECRKAQSPLIVDGGHYQLSQVKQEINITCWQTLTSLNIIARVFLLAWLQLANCLVYCFNYTLYVWVLYYLYERWYTAGMTFSFIVNCGNNLLLPSSVPPVPTWDRTYFTALLGFLQWWILGHVGLLCTIHPSLHVIYLPPADLL